MSNVQRQIKLGFVLMPTALATQIAGSLLAARFLGPELFSVFSVLFGVMAVLNLITEMGTGTILMKLVAKGEKPPGHYIAVSLPFLGIVCLLGAAVQFGVIWLVYPEPEIRIAGFICSLNTIIFGSMMAVSCTMRGMGDIGRWLLGFLGHKIAFVVLLVLGYVALGPSLAAAVAAWTIAGALNFVYSVACVWGRTWSGQLRFDWNETRGLIRESIPIGLNSAANQFGQHLDTFIVAAMTTRPEASVYLLAQKLLNPARNILHGAVSTPTFPALVRLADSDRLEFDRQSAQLCLLQWVSGLPLAVLAWIAAPLVIPALLPKYEPSIPIFWITVWALAPASLSLQLRYSYTALNRQGQYLALNGVYLVTKGGLLVLGTWLYGTTGAAYATVASELLFAVLTLLPISPQRVAYQLAWRTAAATTATAGVVAVLAWLGPRDWRALVLAGGFLLVSAALLNRMLKRIRSHLPRRTSNDGGGEAPLEPAAMPS